MKKAPTEGGFSCDALNTRLGKSNSDTLNIAYISESLGHNDLKATENYLASFEREEREKNAGFSTRNLKYMRKFAAEYPEGVKDRTEAIQHRLKTAGLKRQIGKNQVQVIRFMLSGSPEDMKRIQEEGRLDEWCRDNIDYLKKTFGEENIVATTLHLDETTPHIHASVVPIVQGERRKKKKKPEQAPALCR